MDGYEQWRFPHEDLHVYADACEFLRRLNELRWPSGLGDLKRQLSRAALSISLNICEGRSQKLAGNSGLNFYRIALGSAAECHAAIQALEIFRKVSLNEEIALLRKIGARLSALARTT